MVIIYFIRHGESIVNITKEFSHKKVDKSLTPKGKQQALQLAQYIGNFGFSSIYSSPLKRAFETAEAISSVNKIPVKIIEEFREINVGQMEGEFPSEQAWQDYFDVIDSWKSGNPKKRFPDGENKIELNNRFKLGISKVFSDCPKDSAVIVGHGGIFAHSLFEILNNITPEFLENRPNWPNCGITTCELTNYEGTISGKLIEFGNTSFLTGFASQLIQGVPEYIDR